MNKTNTCSLKKRLQVFFCFISFDDFTLSNNRQLFAPVLYWKVRYILEVIYLLKKVTLYTHELKQLRRFYMNVLSFPISEVTSNS